MSLHILCTKKCLHILQAGLLDDLPRMQSSLPQPHIAHVSPFTQCILCLPCLGANLLNSPSSLNPALQIPEHSSLFGIPSIQWGVSVFSAGSRPPQYAPSCSFLFPATLTVFSLSNCPRLPRSSPSREWTALWMIESTS